MSAAIAPQVGTWAAGRGIGQTSLERLGVRSGEINFGSGRETAIVFPYFENGECVNYKARSIHGEKNYKQKSGGKQIFFNLDEVLSGPLDIVYIVEGELDAVSLVEAGFATHEVLSVPGGAPAEASDEPERLQRYAFVLHALSTPFSQVKKYVLAVDNDARVRNLERLRALRNQRGIELFCSHDPQEFERAAKRR